MAYERNWGFSFNNPYTPTSAVDQTKYQVWALKGMLTGQWGGFTQGLWTVYSSCDGAGNFGNGDFIDWWGPTYDPTKFVFGTAGNPHSWIVLKSPLMNGFNFYLDISLDSATTTTASLFCSKAAPTGGTNTATPTASPQWGFGTLTVWNSASSSGVLNFFNMILSDTGDFVYFPVQVGQTNPASSTLTMAVIAPISCHPSDNFPLMTYKHFINTSAGFLGVVFTNASAEQGCLSADGVISKSVALMHYFSPIPSAAPDILTNKYITMPCRIAVDKNSGAGWHIRGRLPDIHLTYSLNDSSAMPPCGLTIRDGSRNIIYVSVGCLWLPCNNTPPIF